jgi:hypothetical protein
MATPTKLRLIREVRALPVLRPLLCCKEEALPGAERRHPK